MGLSLIIQLLSGAAGGNAAGALMKNLSLGTLWNSVVGILCGGLGGKLMGMVSGAAGAAAASGSMDISSIIASVAAGGIGGGAGMAIIGMVKKMMAGGSTAS